MVISVAIRSTEAATRWDANWSAGLIQKQIAVRSANQAVPVIMCHV